MSVVQKKLYVPKKMMSVLHLEGWGEGRLLIDSVLCIHMPTQQLPHHSTILLPWQSPSALSCCFFTFRIGHIDIEDSCSAFCITCLTAVSRIVIWESNISDSNFLISIRMPWWKLDYRVVQFINNYDWKFSAARIWAVKLCNGSSIYNNIRRLAYVGNSWRRII